MGQQDHAARLTALVSDWPGLETAPHRFGGVEFRVDRREIGHIHHGGMLDLPFPVRVRRELVAAGRAEAHHMLPNTGWVTFRIRTEHELPAAVELLRLNYNRLRGARTTAPILPVLGKLSMVHDDGGDQAT